MIVKIKEVAKIKKKWSLYRLAKEAAIPQQTIYGWANGRTQPSYENMDLLCQLLDCQMSDLFAPEANKIDINERKKEYNQRQIDNLRKKILSQM
jgi:transcriptional regulator with XRE-family HTH domain